MQVKQDINTQVAVQKIITILEFMDEMKTAAKQRIAEDNAQINDLLQKNKALVKSLTNRYLTSTTKIKELEKALDNLTKQVGDKDAEIASLTKELEALHINVTNLNQKIETITAQREKAIQEKNQVIEEQTNDVNTVYYILLFSS